MQTGWTSGLVAGASEQPTGNSNNRKRAISSSDDEGGVRIEPGPSNMTLDKFVTRRVTCKASNKKLKKPVAPYPPPQPLGKQKSWVCQYFISDPMKTSVVRCRLCSTDVKRAQNTSNMISHMEKNHTVIWKGKTTEQRLESSSAGESYDERASKIPFKSQTPKITDVFSNMISLAPGGRSHDGLTNSILFMIAKDKCPMSIVEKEGFQFMCSQFRPLYS